ncbi:MAG: carboxypeptidase regulatory-like domain-containing protein [Acidobacteria bacterium]|nr:carboxypeptidase regulatory-like domain-containing protein [Acidobacteriota bacterium]
MRMTFWMLVLLALISLSYAQETRLEHSREPFEISGEVIESGLDRGLGGVEVALESVDPGAMSTLAPNEKIATAETDEAGVFRFSVTKPGTYQVSVRKDGYSAGASIEERLRTRVTVTISLAHPTRSLRFRLGRPAQISGVVIEKDTRNPVRGLAVIAQGFAFFGGKRVLLPGQSALTDESGRFSVRGLPPGDYVVGLGPRMRSAMELDRSPELRAFGQELLLTAASEKDLERVDSDYDWTYWPGGSGLDAALPVQVSSGAELDIGGLEVRKTAKYRARVIIPKASCKEGEPVSVHVISASAPSAGTLVGKVPCGADFVVRGLSPGAHRLELRGSEAKGSADLHIGRENISVSVPLEKGNTMEGRLAVQGSMKMDATQVRILLKSRHWVVEHSPVRVNSDGRFRFQGVATGDYLLEISGIPATHCLRGILYNGTPISGQTVSLNPYALAHSVELVVDDQAAAVTGSVSNRNQRAFRPWVVLCPVTAQADVFGNSRSTEGDEDGQFRFEGLAPGEYRVIAVPMELKGRLEHPHILEGLLRSAEKLSLAGRQVLTVQIKFSSLESF